MIVVTDPDARFAKRVARTVTARVVHASAAKELDRLIDGGADAVEVVILGPGIDAAEALDVASRMQVSAPEVSMVLVADALSTELLQSALRVGVRDILPVESTDEQLAGTLERAQSLARQLRDRAPAPPAEVHVDRSSVITVFSSKGGVGKSFIASNLAVTLAKRTGQPVALVDLDLQFGDLAIMLQLFPARTMYDAAQNLSHLDAEALGGYLARHPSNVHLLAAPFEPGLAETIPAEAVGEILRMLKRSFRYVVVDSPAAFTEHIVAALDESDSVALLTSMDVPSIKNLKLALQTLDLLGVGREKIRLVLNRADSEVGLRVQDVEKTLGTKVDVSIPSGREVPLSINRGVPLVTEVEYSPVVAALSKLADLVSGESDAAGATRRKHLLRRRAG